MKKTAELIGKYFGIIIIVFMLGGFAIPEEFKWVMGKVAGIPVLTLLLGIIMFGMGMTLKLEDFALVLKRPKDVLLGVVAQFVVMPVLALGIAKLFSLSPALTAGVVLVGTCPGGTSSNVISYMAKGDIALSVTMTSVSTLLAPIMTPFLTYQLIGTSISFDPIGMFWSIVQIVIIPICIGLAFRSMLPQVAVAATAYLPSVSAIAISLIVAGVISVSRENILSTSATILAVVIMHNVLGYLLGFSLAKASGLDWKRSITIAIEVGMQNSGLATGLAKTHFATMPMAAVPGAVFSAWHNISGAILAWLVVKFHKED